jgi:DNA gyrase subunit A
VLQVRDEDEIVLITNSGKLIRTQAGRISLMGRNTQGVKLMELEADDRVVSIGRVAED